MPEWVSYLASGGFGALVALVVTEVIKRAIGFGFAQKLERIKSDLQAKIEKLRTQLGKADFEHRTRFSRFHERRIEVICSLYSKLVEDHLACLNITSPFRSDEPSVLERLKAAFDKAFSDFRRAYELSLLFLDRPVRDVIGAFNDKVIKAVVDVTTYNVSHLGDDPQARADKTRLWVRASEIAREDIPPIRDAIEGQFRRLLGVEQPDRDYDSPGAEHPRLGKEEDDVCC